MQSISFFNITPIVTPILQQICCNRQRHSSNFLVTCVVAICFFRVVAAVAILTIVLLTVRVFTWVAISLIVVGVAVVIVLATFTAKVAGLADVLPLSL